MGTEAHKNEFSLRQWLRCHQYAATWTTACGIVILLIEAFTR